MFIVVHCMSCLLLSLICYAFAALIYSSMYSDVVHGGSVYCVQFSSS